MLFSYFAQFISYFFMYYAQLHFLCSFETLGNIFLSKKNKLLFIFCSYIIVSVFNMLLFSTFTVATKYSHFKTNY